MDDLRIAFTAPGVAAIERGTVSAPERGQVLVRTLYSAVSAGTERDFLLGRSNTGGAFPRYLGYSATAQVLACGEGATRFFPGQHVLVYHGGHRAYSVVEEARLSPVLEGVDLLQASLVIIASMGLQGVRKTRMELGESGLVIGQGLLGLFATQAMRASGGCPVLALDFDPARLALARQVGAHEAFSPDDPALVARIMEMTGGRGVNAIVEVTGSEAALTTALQLSAREGRIALTGCTRTHAKPLDLYQLLHKPGVQLIGAHNAVRPEKDSRPGCWTQDDDYRTVMQLMLDGRMQVAPLISEAVSPMAAPEVYHRLATDAAFPLGIIFDWNLL